VNIPSNIITLVAGIILTVISVWFGQNHGLMPVAASAEASEVDGLFNLMVTIACGLFLIVQSTLVICVIKFRRRPGDTTDGPPIEGNIPLEIVWTAIPTIIVFILAIYSFEVYNSMGGLDPMATMASHHMPSPEHKQHEQMVAMASNNPTQVGLGIGQPPEDSGKSPIYIDVNGIQYAWIFTYAESGIVSGELRVPIGHPVHLNMKAGDVIHAFWLPEFRIKQDVIPGTDTTLVFTPTRNGDYPIICAELCGAYHGGMKSRLYVVSEAEYEQWLQENTVAQINQETKTVAVNTTEMSDREYLAPYGTEIGINSEIISQLKQN